MEFTIQVPVTHMRTYVIEADTASEALFKYRENMDLPEPDDDMDILKTWDEHTDEACIYVEA